MRKFLLFLLLLAPFGVRLLACSCIGESTVKGSVKSSDLVIVGTVVSGELIYEVDSAWSFGKDSLGNDRFVTNRKMKFRILVTNTFKGKFRGDTITVITGTGNGDCGYNFQTGSSYIIYGQKSDASRNLSSNEFTTDNCTRTRLATDTAEIDAIRKATRKYRRSAH